MTSSINSKPSVQKNINISFDEFLRKHMIKSEDKNDEPKNPTNTRIGDKKSNIYGGSYYIPDEEYETFLNLYYRDVLYKNGIEYLTEKQRNGDGPIVVDLDFRYGMDIKERQHTKEHIQDLVMSYLDVLKTMFQFDSSVKFNVFVLEKPSVNIIADKKLVKDGIHMIISLQADHVIQRILRERVMKVISENWTDLPLKNSWDDVFDEGISIGYTNWQLIGSRKPNHDAYKITYIYEIKYDDTDDELGMLPVAIRSFDMAKNMKFLSVRYAGHPSFFMKSSFIDTYNQYKNFQGGSAISNTIRHTPSPSGNEDFDMADINSYVAKVSNASELQFLLNMFLDKITYDDYELKEAYDYTMCLPESYYSDGTHNKWIRVGWVLKHISNKLLIVWVAFSSQWTNFKYTDIPDLCEKWKKFDSNKSQGLSKRSLMYWARQDAAEKYHKVFEHSIDYFVEFTINMGNGYGSDKNKHCGDFDLARVLYQCFKNRFICVSIKGNVWYQFKNNRWVEDDQGTTLRKAISIELREIYNKKSFALLNGISRTNSVPNIHGGNNQNTETTDEEQSNYNKVRTQRILDICNNRLSNRNAKDNIMKEAKDLFYDGTFFTKLDSNPYLLCFSNGVFDFKEKAFRQGRPEDYVSMCTNIDYRVLDETRDKATIDLCLDFMHKLFPEQDLFNYMYDHLASTLIGVAANQTFNMYIGVGQNGKSVLITLMEKILGEYVGIVPLTLLTEGRTRVGGLSPEMVQLKGVRYAVMQEPTKGDKINEGIMKQMTSGIDPLQARAPYMLKAITFIPQFKLVVCSNVMLEIKSNDHGTWRRIRVVPYKSLFTENPVADDPEKPYQFKIDKKIIERFDDWKEVFAAMLVKRVLETDGLVKDCDIVMAESNIYRESQDYISEFIRDKIVKDPNGKIKKTELNNEFTMWYQSTYGRGGPSPKDVHDYIDKQFGKQKNQLWTGIKIRYERDDLDIPELEEDDGVDANELE